MAFTVDQVAALERAIAAGKLSVRYEDMSVQYRSLDEMIRLLERMKREAGLSKGGSTSKYPSHSKGLQ